MCLYFVDLVTRYGSHFGRIDLVKNSLVLKFGDFGVVSYDVFLEFELVFEVCVAFLLLFFKTDFNLFKVLITLLRLFLDLRQFLATLFYTMLLPTYSLLHLLIFRH